MMSTRRYLIPLLMLMTGVLLIGAALAASSTATASTDTTAAVEHNRPGWHGTPDPNATPEVSSSTASFNNPTYYADIEPILAQECMSCHLQGDIGYAFFPMDDVADITDPDNAEYIAFVTGIEYMPPWPPGDASAPLAHERALSDDEIALIAQWAENGAPLGDEADRNLDDIETTVPQLREDVVLQLPEYTPTGEILDDYRCFLVDPGFTEDTYITGMHLMPGNAEIAHHAIYFMLGPAQLEEAQSINGADGRPGWPCYGGPNLASNRQVGAGSSLNNIDQQAFVAALNDQGADIPALVAALQNYRSDNPDAGNFAALQDVLIANGVDVQRLIADLDLDVASMTGSGMGGSMGGWVPGAVPVLAPENSGLLMPAGSQLVVQMHYNLFTNLGTDQSTLILQTEPYRDDITPIMARPMVAPVEIPCPEGVTGPDCEREVAMQQVVNPATSTALLAACGQTLETYATNTAANAYSYCDYPITRDLWVLSVGPHMHELGTAATITVNPGQPDEQVLIDIPDWDFHWQGQYDLATPVEVGVGDTIRVECWWDNSDGERYVVWGEGTQDEMCFHFMRFLPREEGKTLADYGFEPASDTGMMAGHDGQAGHDGHSDHNHDQLVEIGDDAPIPSVALSVTPTAAGGYFVALETENFDFAPEAVDGPHVEGQGHAHLYVNGEKITRLYGPEYFIESLPSGDVEIRVTLNANDHATYAHHGEPIADTVIVRVE